MTRIRIRTRTGDVYLDVMDRLFSSKWGHISWCSLALWGGLAWWTNRAISCIMAWLVAKEAIRFTLILNTLRIYGSRSGVRWWCSDRWRRRRSRLERDLLINLRSILSRYLLNASFSNLSLIFRPLVIIDRLKIVSILRQCLTRVVAN